jgi:hypothetical protein
MKVRVGQKYRYNGVPFDRFDGHLKPAENEIVRVINLPGAPKANTMGMCYVTKLDGTFSGMVMTPSLQPAK